MNEVSLSQKAAVISQNAVKIIKRYANRKLYDTSKSCYITLNDIAEMVCQGDHVQVIDNRSGRDLTTITLAQILFETEKRKHFMPLNVLRDLILESAHVPEPQPEEKQTEPSVESVGTAESLDKNGLLNAL
jgi:polyhydroxyalkanoate synthesis repressor PhaR